MSTVIYIMLLVNNVYCNISYAPGKNVYCNIYYAPDK